MLWGYLEELFDLKPPKQSIQGVHILFPDPWPKKRHQKRRLFQTENLRMLWEIMKPNSQIYIATDHEDYFQQIKEGLF